MISLLLGLLLGWGGWGDVPLLQVQSADTSRRPVALQADSLIGGVDAAGRRFRELIGHVFLQQDETRLWADRATQWPEERRIRFVGNVRIVERGDSLAADTVYYDSRQKVGRAVGRVRLWDGSVMVEAPMGWYYTREKRAVFEAGVRLADSAAVLTSQRGVYWSDEKRAAFYGNVRLEGKNRYLEADTVIYFRDTEVALAKGHVFIEQQDTTEDGTVTRTLLLGREAFNNEQTGYSRLTGRPLLVLLRPEDAGRVDTLLVRAGQLHFIRQDSLRRLVAVDSVRLWQQRLSARADSLVYDRVVQNGTILWEEVRLFGQPIAWLEETQVSGDTLWLRGGADRDTLWVFPNAFVVQRDTVLNRLQQLKGRRLTGYFAQDSLRKLIVGPNAEAIYYLRDRNDSLQGAVRVSGDEIVFWFEQSRVRRVRVWGGVQGVQYERDRIPMPFQLEGFRWVPELRPEPAHFLQETWIRQRLRMLPKWRQPAPPAAPAANPTTHERAERH
ncbi:OstA-like protein [Rhodothermus profundi]|uniref:OstA-like protein n=1 Tax=Rhodothermus profundi TaxID=633813 RepID=A0A1M6Q663_9BACT|nr:OstA-like protein [Rhodothermus profundi]SHK15754.1 OstA-like protein [Rhodothermus profundi]